MTNQQFILVPGAEGTIGRRLVAGLRAANIPFIPVINSGKAKYDLDGKQLTFPHGTLIADGNNIQERIARAKESGHYIIGKIGNLNTTDIQEFDWSKVAAIADCCTNSGTRDNINRRYPEKTPLLVQGGTKIQDTDNFEHFVTANYSNAHNLFNTSSMNKLKVVSCNANGISQVLGNAALGLGSPENVTSASILLQRRFADEEDVGKSFDPEDQTFKQAEKYGNDVSSAMNPFTGKIKSIANKNPWRSHHVLTYDIEFSKGSFESVMKTFQEDPRTIVVDKSIFNDGDIETGLAYLSEVSRQLGIPYGDTPLNTVYLELKEPGKIRVEQAVAQRWSAMPSTFDTLWGIADVGEHKKVATLREAMEITNKLPLAYGHTFPEIKAMHEQALNKKPIPITV